MRKSVVLAILLCLFFSNFCYSFEFRKNSKKKQSEQIPKMVETVEEWETEAQNIPIEQRDNKNPTVQETDKKFHYPKAHYVFEKYNYPQGKRTHDISEIRNRLIKTPTIVADNSCHWVAYSQYYFSPDDNQISSNFYVGKLDTSKTKTKRILDYNHKTEPRKPIIESGTKETYPNLFNALVLVDWSNNSRKLLVKENIGSIYGGIYKTNLYVYFMPQEIKAGRLVKLDNFEETIKHYYLNYENIQLAKYRYSIEPLGFSADNDELVIALFYSYDTSNNKVFMGSWAYNLITGETILISKENPSQEVSANGLVLRQVLN